jgi:LmbE family N-acetylglucosaminyl deacetylase
VAHLDLLDAQYMLYQDPRTREVVERWPGSFVEAARRHVNVSARIAEVARAVAPVLTPGSIVYAPVGIGGHPDHRVIGEFAVGLVDTGCQVRLWADHPYFVRYGLPSWLGDEPNQVSDALVADSLAALVDHRLTLTRRVVTLDAESLLRKLAATRRYVTEYDAIQADFGSAMDPAYLQYEVVWTASASRA